MSTKESPSKNFGLIEDNTEATKTAVDQAKAEIQDVEAGIDEAKVDIQDVELSVDEAKAEIQDVEAGVDELKALVAPTTTVFSGVANDTLDELKATAGKIHSLMLKNTTAAAAYFQLFNALAANVTLGTTAPYMSIGLAANESMNVELDKPIPFATAVTCAGTTTRDGLTAAAIDYNGILE